MESSTQPDYALFDRLGVDRLIFYPRRDRSPAPGGAVDYQTEVEPGVQVASRFYPTDPAFPTILFFHGNGEVAADYDEIAPAYHQAGVNLWVAEYRGYGASGGTPSVAGLVGDSHPIAAHFEAVLAAGNYHPARFVMGRSLGTHSATELAARQPDLFKGLIVESGSTNLGRLLRYFGGVDPTGEAAEVVERHRAKIAGISLPTLIIHGEQDELIPVELAVELYDTLTVDPKELLIIPRAGHNDILWVGRRDYFARLGEFVKSLSGE